VQSRRVEDADNKGSQGAWPDPPSSEPKCEAKRLRPGTNTSSKEEPNLQGRNRSSTALSGWNCMTPNIPCDHPWF